MENNVPTENVDELRGFSAVLSNLVDMAEMAACLTAHTETIVNEITGPSAEASPGLQTAPPTFHTSRCFYDNALTQCAETKDNLHRIRKMLDRL